MIMRTATFAAMMGVGVFLAGCELPDDAQGRVVSFTDTMVVVEAYGGFSTADYRSPPQGIQAQAQELCATRDRSARFLNADLEDTTGSQALAMLQYRFACV